MTYIVYSKDGCPNCDKAVAQLEMAGKRFITKKFGVDYSLEDLWLIAGAPVRTMPFICVSDDEGLKPIGGLPALTKHLMGE